MATTTADLQRTPTPPLSQLRIGFLGFGRMGQAIARGLARDGGQVAALYGCDPNWSDEVAQECQVGRCHTIEELDSCSDLVVLAVKPQQILALMGQISGEKIYLSVAAGVTIDSLRKASKCPDKVRIVRCMPNLPATVGAGVTAICSADSSLSELSAELLQTLGRVQILADEKLLHAVTGLSGSGPAYAFAFFHALAEGGVAAGLNYGQALEMAIETVIGAGRLCLESGEHPAALRSQVASPAGTTIAGLMELEKGAFHATTAGAVVAAAKRSRELGGE